MTVRQTDLHRFRRGCPILGPVPLYDHHRTGLSHIRTKALSGHRVGSVGFNRPDHCFFIWPWHVEVDPHVGICPLHPRDRSPELHRLAGIEFGRERMMRQGRPVLRPQLSPYYVTTAQPDDSRRTGRLTRALSRGVRSRQKSARSTPSALMILSRRRHLRTSKAQSEIERTKP
jgi:hypothetical protein